MAALLQEGEAAPEEAPPDGCIARIKTIAPEYKLTLACALALAHAWISIMCLLEYKTFVSMLTGGALFLARDCVDGFENITSSPAAEDVVDFDRCALHASVFWSYIFGFVMYRLLSFGMGFYISSTFNAVIVGILLFAVDLTHKISQTRYEVCFAAVAMGLVNATALVVHGKTTHLISISIQRLVNALCDLAMKVGKPAAKKDVVKETLALSTSYILGGFLGSVLTHMMHHWRFTPLAILFFLILAAHDVVHAASMAVVKKNADEAKKSLLSHKKKIPSSGQLVAPGPAASDAVSIEMVSTASVKVGQEKPAQ